MVKFEKVLVHNKKTKIKPKKRAKPKRGKRSKKRTRKRKQLNMFKRLSKMHGKKIVMKREK